MSETALQALNFLREESNRERMRRLRRQSVGGGQSVDPHADTLPPGPAPGQTEIEWKNQFSSKPTQAASGVGYKKVAGMDPALFSMELKKRGVDPQEFNTMKKFYQKKGIQKTPEEIMDELGQTKFTQQFRQSFSPSQQAPKGIPAPMQTAQQPQQQSPLKSRLQKMKQKVRREDFQTMTRRQKQLKEAIKAGIILSQKRALMKETVKEVVLEQKQARDRIEYLLEGPGGLSNAWQGIKGEIKGAGQKLGIGSQGTGEMAQDVAQQAGKELTQALKRVEQAKGKFQQQILKNAEVINQYHDAVLAAYQVYQQVGKQLGPASQQMGDSVMNAIEEMKSSLESEKSQIDSFMKGLKSPDKALSQNFMSGAGESEGQIQRDPNFFNPQVGASAGVGGMKGTGPGDPMARAKAPRERTPADEFGDFQREFAAYVQKKYNQPLSMYDPKLVGKAFSKFMLKKFNIEVPKAQLAQIGQDLVNQAEEGYGTEIGQEVDTVTNLYDKEPTSEKRKRSQTSRKSARTRKRRKKASKGKDKANAREALKFVESLKKYGYKL